MIEVSERRQGIRSLYQGPSGTILSERLYLHQDTVLTTDLKHITCPQGVQHPPMPPDQNDYPVRTPRYANVPEMLNRSKLHILR